MRCKWRCMTGLLVTSLSLLSSSGTASAWVVPDGNPVPVSGIFPFPDPSAVGYGSGGAGVQLHGTASSGRNIPTENWQTPGGSTTNGAGDALVGLPSDIVLGGSWAPSAAYIQGRYVMWFVGVQTSGMGANLEAAYSQNAQSAQGQYTVAYRYQNASQPAYGLLDPALWQDSGGTWWLFWSVQNGSDHTSNAIYSARLTTDGLQFASGAYLLATYTAMDTVVSGSPRGNNPQLENPAFATDPQGTYNYNMTMSFGSHDLIGSYRTINIACDSPAGSCGWNTSQLNTFDSQVRGNTGLSNSGGASFVQSSAAYAEAFMPFAAVPGGNTNHDDRQMYSDKTNSGILKPNQYLFAGSEQQGIAFCMCLPNRWKLRMQTDGNLVIYDQSGQSRWQGGGSGGSPSSYAVMQGDGNFVVYDNGNVRFHTGTNGHPGAYLRFQNSDGNLVVYSTAGQALWQSGT